MIFNYKPTKDAKTLDGHGAEYFVSAFELVENANDITKSGFYKCTQNIPFDYGIANVIMVGDIGGDSNIPTQIAFGIDLNPTTRDLIAIRSYVGDSWAEWTRVVKIADLANYLPLTGGTINGELLFKKAENGYGKIQKANADADYGTYVSDFSADGNAIGLRVCANEGKIYHVKGSASNEILHTGNIADHVLSKNGGRLTRQDNVIMELESTHQNFPLIGFFGTGGQLGNLGFNGVGNPCYAENNGTARTLHHDGNSAKVVISSTAPSDTSALWVY